MKLLITIVIIFVFSCPPMANGKSLCSGENANLYCLKENFSELYSTNYGLFWKILHNAAKKLKDHKNISDITAFLELSTIIKGNAEVTEYFSKICENFCVSNPAICLEALISLDEKSIKSILDRLRNPIYLSKTDINNIFQKNKNIKKYQKIASLYFQCGTKRDVDK
ncbi:MAG: hypothetical protein KAR20_13850 [Candidatus Heimdallarchaeota archaeon]|nr:hypothetical protein [Candidatus Heimdallarchaeota archaeon]